MSWTYDPADLDTNPVDQIRLEIGDTDPNDQLLQNSEIVYAATQEDTFWGTCARCCEMISRFYARKADVRLGRSMQITYTKTFSQYQDMAARLRIKAGGTSVPFVGGMFVVDAVNYAQQSGLIQPIFTKTMMQNPWTGGYTSDSLLPVGGGEFGIGFGG